MSLPWPNWTEQQWRDAPTHEELKQRRRTREAFTTPVHEANDCHTPAGSPKGGQFCSKTGWHLTDNPRFVPDPTRKPTLNRVFLSDLMQDSADLPAGLFITDAPEYWMQAHGYERPYVAQVKGTVGPGRPGGARVSREDFLQGEAKTLRVLTIDEYAREVFGEEGWVEGYFSDDPRPKKMPKGYRGRSVDEMTPAELAEWERKFAEWVKRKR